MVHDETSSVPKVDNDTILKTGVDFEPLLEGNFQFGKLGTMHKNLATNELRLRNISGLITDGVHMLAIMIKESEHLGWIDLEKDLNHEQKHRLKIFTPRFLTVQKGDKDYTLSSNNS